MPVVAVVETPGGSAEFYDQVMPKIEADGLPEGMQSHVAGPIEGGWRVITVWDTEEAFHSFREQKLIPALREVSGDEPPPATIDIQPVHRLIRG